MRTITTITTAFLALALVTACTPQAEELADARPVPLMLTATLAQATTAQPTRAAELPSAGRTTVPIALTAGKLPITMSSLPGASAATTMPEPVTKQYALGAIPDNPAATLTPVVSGAAGTLVAPNPGAYTFAVEPAKVTAKIMQTNVPTPLNLRVQMIETQLTVNHAGTLSSDLALAPTTAGMRLILKVDDGVSLSAVLSLLSGEEAPTRNAVDANPSMPTNTDSRIVALTGTGTYAVAFGMLPPATDVNAGDLLATITTKTHGSSITKTLALLAPAPITLPAGEMVTYTVHVNHSLATITGVSIGEFAAGNGTGDDITVGDKRIVMADGTSALDQNIFNANNPVWVITGNTDRVLTNVKDALTALSVTSGGNLISSARIHVILPNFASTIGQDAFSGCKALASFSAPKVTGIIGQAAFWGCENLTSVDLPAAEGLYFNVFIDCTALTTVNLPKVTGTIEDNAFSDCTNLTSISLPLATKIDNNVFGGCTNLTSVDLPSAETIGEAAFQDCTALTTISLPKATSIGNSAFKGCTALASISAPNVTGTIGKAAFQGCTALTTLDMLATKIAISAFQGCTNLTSVSLPAAESIAFGAFQGCTKLATVVLPKATSIGGDVFWGCPALTTINLPAAEIIPSGAFQGCTNLTTVVLPKATRIGDNVFWGCPALTRLELTQSTAPITMASKAFDNTDTSNITLVLNKSVEGNTENTIGVKVEDATDGKKKVTFLNGASADVTATFKAVEYLN